MNAVYRRTIDAHMVDDMPAHGMLSINDLLAKLLMKRLGKAEKIADAVLPLFCPASSFVAVQALAVVKRTLST